MTLYQIDIYCNQVYTVGMLSNILGTIFKHDGYNYTAKPWHHWVSILLMAGGVLTFLDKIWWFFGVCIFILGFITGAWIIYDGWITKQIEYWEVVSEAVKLSIKSDNPEVKRMFYDALGIQRPSETVRVIEDVNNGQGFISTKIHDLPVTMSELQVISDTVLSGTSFSENEIVTKRKILSAPKFRELRKTFENRQFIKPHNVKHRNQGFAITRKGQQVLYQYASESVKGELKKNGKE